MRPVSEYFTDGVGTSGENGKGRHTMDFYDKEKDLSEEINEVRTDDDSDETCVDPDIQDFKDEVNVLKETQGENPDEKV